MLDAFAYPPTLMGTANWVWNTGSVPSLPGNTKSKSDQSSGSRFCTGVPVMMILQHRSTDIRAGFRVTLTLNPDLNPIRSMPDQVCGMQDVIGTSETHGITFHAVRTQRHTMSCTLWSRRPTNATIESHVIRYTRRGTGRPKEIRSQQNETCGQCGAVWRQG